MKSTRQSNRLTTRDIALIGMMAAVVEVSKMALSFLPNVELVTFWMMMFTLFFGKKVIYAALVFVMMEVGIYGLHTWTIMYLYIWPLLSLVTWTLRDYDSTIIFAFCSGVFGLLFGALCSIPYLVIGGLKMAFGWWVAGIPYDILHGISNFVLMLVLYRPVRLVMERFKMKI